MAKVEERLAGVIVSLWDWARKDLGSLPLTQEELAAITGGSLRGVAAGMMRFLREGALAHSAGGGYHVLSPEALMKAAGPTLAHRVHQIVAPQPEALAVPPVRAQTPRRLDSQH